MDTGLFGRGLVLGFTIAAAVGPISLLVIRRTLAEGRVVGLVSGMGVATADATYGAIAAFGLTAVTELLVDWRRVLGIVGGVFLLWLAYRTFTSVPREAAGESYNLKLAGDWTATGIDGGCVEAAVMSGRLAAHAVSKLPRLEDIVGYDHP